MTYKISMEVSANQIEELIEQLPIKDQIRLARKLKDKTSVERLKVQSTLTKIDSRKGRRPTVKEILQEIHTYRKEKNAKSSH